MSDLIPVMNQKAEESNLTVRMLLCVHIIASGRWGHQNEIGSLPIGNTDEMSLIQSKCMYF